MCWILFVALLLILLFVSPSEQNLFLKNAFKQALRHDIVIESSGTPQPPTFPYQFTTATLLWVT